MFLTPEEKTIADLYEETCKKAIEQSKTEDCTKHVNAIVLVGSLHRPLPYVSGFTISDWCDGTTIASFTYGRGR